MNRKLPTITLSLLLILSVIASLPLGPSSTHGAGDFSLTANPATIGPISTQGAGTTVIMVTAVSSFTGTIALTSGISPQAGLTAGLNPSSVMLTSSVTTVNSILTVNGSAAGTYLVTVNGTSGSIKHSTQVTVTVIEGGLVCIASTSGVPPPPANPCPSAPGPVLRSSPPTTPPGQLRVGVYINGSDSMNTFDITLLADHTILLPIDATLTGSVLGGSPSVLVKCIGGKNQLGPGACPSTDNADTLHFSASITGVTSKPTTGLLFIAIYNVTGSTSLTGITISFQTGCVNTSVRNQCVDIGNGTPIPVPERSQGGFFSDAPDFSITVSPNLVSFASTLTGTSTLTAKSLSTFSGTVSLSSTTNSTNLSVSFTKPSLTVSSGGTAQTLVTFSSSVVANYTATLTGTSGSTSHSANVTVVVIPRFDFSVSANPSAVTFDNGTSITSIITVKSTTGFTGFVDISTSVAPATGLRVTYNTTTLKLVALGSTNSSLATFSSSTPGDYLVTITGQNGTSLPIHKIIIPVHVADFNITAVPASVIVYVGAASNSTIGVASRFNFAGVVTLAATANSTGLTPNLLSSSLTLSGGGTASTLLFLTGTFGNYTVTVTGTSGPLSHKVVLAVTVKHPDFGMTANPVHVIDLLSASNVTTISITRLGSFNGTITLSTTTITGITNPLSRTTIVLNATLRGGTSTMNITVAQTATPGNYVLTMTGVNATGSPSHSIQVLLTILQPDFVPSLTASSFTMNVGQSVNSVLEIFSKNHFTGTVTLLASINPSSSVTTSFNSTSLLVAVGGETGATVTISAPVGTTAGNYTVTITETSGSIVHTSTISLVIGDFQIAILTPTLTVSMGFSQNANISLTSINHFKGNVTLTTASVLTGLPAIGIVSLTIDSNQFVLVQVTAPNNTATGTYIMTVTGNIGPVSHSVTITVTVIVHDLAVTSVTATPASGDPGGIVTYTITVKNEGNVTEHSTVEALAGYVTVDQQNVTLQPGESQTVTLKWNTNGFAPGSYVLGAKVIGVTNEANTANNMMSTTGSFTLNSPPQPVVSLGVILETSVIGIVIVAIVAAAIFFLRRRKPAQTV